MSMDVIVALLPLVLVGATSLIVMLGIACKRSHALTAGLTLFGLAAALLSIDVAVATVPQEVGPVLLVDRYALFYMGLIIASAAVVVVLSYQYFDGHEGQREELYLLLLIATFGCAVLVASSHFVTFLLGLEILSVSLYALIAYVRDRQLALEAGIKYLILASASAAFLLFGMALIYAVAGTLEFARIREITPSGSEYVLLVAGIVLALTGIGFKLGVVPFHLWTPDVYQGAPAPVAAFVATTSKGAMVALLLRSFYLSDALHYPAVSLAVALVAVGSMCAGNFLALQQMNVKRILAYSSIAHFGYILVAFLAAGSLAIEAAGVYVTAYTVTVLIAFGIVTVLSGPAGDADDLENYRGLFWRRPLTAAVFTTALLSLAGIPGTIGFVGKFYVLATGVATRAWPLMIILVITSVAGLFYYLRIVVTLYAAAPERAPIEATRRMGASAVVLVLALLLIGFGIYPARLLTLTRTTTLVAPATAQGSPYGTERE